MTNFINKAILNDLYGKIEKLKKEIKDNVIVPLNRIKYLEPQAKIMINQRLLKKKIMKSH